TKRGYTLHEHLDNSGLVHMNARLYDPLMARFLSPDPVLAYPENPQDLNRYSYVWNGPLSAKDPSGECYYSVGNGVRCFSHANDVKNSVLSMADDAWRNGRYGSALIGYGLGSLQTVNMAVGFFSDAVLAPGNGSYNLLSGLREGDSSRAVGGGAELLLSLTMLKLGNPTAAAPRGAADTTRVGRWMSETEFNLMNQTGRVVEGAGGRTYVVNPANPVAFTGAGRGSSIYAEFNVPTNVLKLGSKPEWSVIPGPNVTTRLYGPAPAELAPATCIVCVIRNP
ncbi:MAG: RHS repeat-associated core domain-containing protein, partial [Moraxellaceae bacterium]|nr:RHS repeat-associated core domain-containing protein [Moraxellaceae bacterium]